MNKGVVMIEVTAAIIIDQGQVLIAKKESTHKLAGLWEFPGGKMEPGETPEACLERELVEELGISIEITDFFAEYTFPLEKTVLHLNGYKARVTGGTLTLHEHDDARWVALSELNRYSFVPSDMGFVERLTATL